MRKAHLLPMAFLLLAACNTQGNILRAGNATPLQPSDEAATDTPDQGVGKYVCCHPDNALPGAKPSSVNSCRTPPTYYEGKVSPYSCGADEAATPFTDPRVYNDEASCKADCLADPVVKPKK